MEDALSESLEKKPQRRLPKKRILIFYNLIRTSYSVQNSSDVLVYPWMMSYWCLTCIIVSKKPIFFFDNIELNSLGYNLSWCQRYYLWSQWKCSDVHKHNFWLCTFFCPLSQFHGYNRPLLSRLEGLSWWFGISGIKRQFMIEHMVFFCPLVFLPHVSNSICCHRNRKPDNLLETE